MKSIKVSKEQHVATKTTRNPATMGTPDIGDAKSKEGMHASNSRDIISYSLELGRSDSNIKDRWHSRDTCKVGKPTATGTSIRRVVSSSRDTRNRRKVRNSKTTPESRQQQQGRKQQLASHGHGHQQHKNIGRCKVKIMSRVMNILGMSEIEGTPSTAVN